MSAPRRSSSEFFFAAVKVLFLAVGGFALIWMALGLADVILGLDWGFTWSMIPFGFLMVAGAYVGFRFIGLIEKVLAGKQSGG